ncbi:hypothetical protein F5Y19DRAFT_492027 [Xylariaceae sp. FL1651]|nr:hypothetical protein F5Y19DRAFT_492027 [Xylariaceae sp. FL1651]
MKIAAAYLLLVTQAVISAGAYPDCWFDPVGLSLPTGSSCIVTALADTQANALNSTCANGTTMGSGTFQLGAPTPLLTYYTINSCIQQLYRDVHAHFSSGFSIRNWDPATLNTLITSSTVVDFGGGSVVVGCNFQFNGSTLPSPIVLGPNIYLMLQNVVNSLPGIQLPDASSLVGLSGWLCPAQHPELDSTGGRNDEGMGWMMNFWPG